MADEVKMFRTYYNGMELTAMIYKSLSGYTLEVKYTDYNGRKHLHFDHCYKNERGAVRALNTRFRGAEWEEFT